MFFATASYAVEPDEILSNPALEARARDISENLRCVVCQNEAIDTSNSGVARDLRLLVRERLVAGDTDDQTQYGHRDCPIQKATPQHPLACLYN